MTLPEQSYCYKAHLGSRVENEPGGVQEGMRGIWVRPDSGRESGVRRCGQR